MIKKYTKLPLFLVVSSLVLSLDIRAQEAKQDEKPRAARSVHLWYPAPEGVIFYNEVTVKESHKGSYFCVCGFRHGYFGIQEIRSSDDKVVIFSVWDPGKQNDPNTVDPEQRVKVLHQGEGVRISRFGNEGTGGKSMFPYPWKVGETYRCMVKADVRQDKTTYSAYFYLNDKKEWKHLASFQTITGGDYLQGYYSFIEDFWRNGESATQVRKAVYGNGWVKTKEGHWVSLTQARFTADRTPTLNINAGVTNDKRFYLITGGRTTNNIPLRSMMSFLPTEIDLPNGISSKNP